MATPEATLFSMLRRDTLGIRRQSLPEKRKYVYESFFDGLHAPACIAVPDDARTLIADAFANRGSFAHHYWFVCARLDRSCGVTPRSTTLCVEGEEWKSLPR
jgi:hypothetical protein